MSSEACEDLVKFLNVLIESIRVNNDVILVHEQYLKCVIVQTSLPKPLVGRGAIGHSHGHSVVLKNSEWCWSSSSIAT